MASRLEQLEEKMRAILREHDDAKDAARAEARQAADLEARKAEAQKGLPELREREAQLWAQHDAAFDGLNAVIAELLALRSELRTAYARPRRTVHNAVKMAVKSELQRRKIRERAASRDLEAEARARDQARAAYLKKVKQQQEQASRQVSGDEGQGDRRIRQTEEAIRSAQGKGPKIIDREGMDLAFGFGFAKKKAEGS